MTISTQSALAGPFTGNGSTTVFSFSFKCFSQADLQVIREESDVQTVLTITTNYTVTLNADQEASPGGNVTMVTAPTATQTVFIVSDVDYTQEAAFTNAGGFYPTVLNDARDRTTLQILQLRDKLDRALLVRVGETPDADALSQIKEINDNLDNILGAEAAVEADRIAVAAMLSTVGGGMGQPISAYGISHAGIVLAEADSAIEYVNLLGQSIVTTLTEAQITKKYFHGELWVTNALGNLSLYRRQSPLLTYEILKRQTKAPLPNVEGLYFGWLGTSIPHQFAGSSGYPELVAKALGATVNNLAWSGSHMSYDPDADPSAINNVKALSMTAVDVAEQLAEHGAGSIYDDAFPDVTNASEMTIDYRIYAPQLVKPFDAVIMDHNHNDRFIAPGTLTPPEYTITGVTKGATTQITVSDATGLSLYDGVTIKALSGIDYLKYYSGSISAIAGNVITLALDSSAFAGTFASGTLIKLDRNTLYGSMDFLSYGVWNGAIRGGATNLPPITWCSAPSRYTGNIDDTHDRAAQSIESNATLIFNWLTNRNQAIEDGGLTEQPYHTFFDIMDALDVKEKDHLVLLEDNVHPITLERRRAIANYWADWWQGGAGRTWHKSELLLTGSSPKPKSNYPVIYSTFSGGYGTPEFTEGAEVSIISEDFVSIADWSTAVGSPVIGAAPWGGDQALNLTVTNGNTAQYLEMDAVGFVNALVGGVGAKFSIYVPDTVGKATATAKVATVFSINRNATPFVIVELIIRPGDMGLRLSALDPSFTPYYRGDEIFILKDATKHDIEVRWIIGDGATYDGGAVLIVDGEVVGSAIRYTNDTLTDMNRVRVGAVGPNTDVTFDYSIGPLEVVSFPTSAYNQTLGQLLARIDALEAAP